MFKKKVIYTLPIYIIWWGIILFCEMKNQRTSSTICELLLKPYMTLIVYPLISFTYVNMVDRKIVLESVDKEIKFHWINTILMVYLILFSLAPYMPV